MTEKLDIYDPDIFEVDGLHYLENESSFNVPFRWSEGLFYIKPKNKIRNVLVNFLCLNEDQKIVIFLENDLKNIKHVKKLKCGMEYILAIDCSNYTAISFCVTPNLKTVKNDIRTLGLFIKNIYTNDLDIASVELISKDEENYNLLTYEQNLHTDNSFKLAEKSIFEQNINLKILPFDYNKKNFLFNSSIFEFNGRKYIFVRKSAFISKNITDNSLKLYDYETLSEINLKINDEVDFEQYEDPRVFVYNNKIYVSCVNYTHDKFHLIHQKILVFDDNFQHVKSIHPKYGFNGKSILENTGKEKNWTFFVKQNRLFCIYSIEPHIVVEFDWDGNVLAEYITHSQICKNWKYGHCRGGTNPILKNNVMYTFFHSSVPWGKGRRRYLMGYYKFNPEPPFNILEMSTEPILWGNEKDERILKESNPPVVFPCGCINDNENLLISFGLNDEKTAILRYNV